MLRTILNTWGKAVNSVWVHSWLNVDARPQVGGIVHVSQKVDVYNRMVMPIYTVYCPQTFPQVFLAKLYLLIDPLSPLSTVPITTTTNLKKEER